jgi:hypothetical protein
MVLSAGPGCGAVWDQRPGAFNDAVKVAEQEMGKIPTDFGAKEREAAGEAWDEFSLTEGSEAKGSARGSASFRSYDEKSKRICFTRRNAHDLEVGDEKKYIAKEKKPETYVIDVWGSLSNLEPLPLPPRGFGPNPVEVEGRGSGATGGGTLSLSNVSGTRRGVVDVWAYVDICGVLSSPLKAGDFVTLSRAQMKQPGFEVEPIPPEVFVWKVTDEDLEALRSGAADTTPPVEPASPEPTGGEPPAEEPTGE